MQKIATILFKAIRRLLLTTKFFIDKIMTSIVFYCNNIQFQRFHTSGVPYVSVARGGSCTIKSNFRMNNGNLGNPIGRPQRCILFVDCGASLSIGENVGISSTAIVAHHQITIGNNVKIGGGVCIYDTDFHSLDPKSRENAFKDKAQKRTSPVSIGDNVFIGAHSTILKGVRIGDNSIVGACSVVTKSIPENEIWAGNPAKFIKRQTPNA